MASHSGIFAVVLSIVVYALAMGLRPEIHAATAELLARGESVLQKLTWMMAGLALGATLMFVVLQFVNPTNFLKFLHTEIDKTIINSRIELITGAAFVGIGMGIAVWRIVRPHPRSKGTRTQAKQATKASAIMHFSIGLASPIFAFTSWPVMYLVVRTISASDERLFVRILVFALFLLLLITPYMLLAWAWPRFPAFAQWAHSGYIRLSHADWRLILSAVCTLSGLSIIAFQLLSAHQ